MVSGGAPVWPHSQSRDGSAGPAAVPRRSRRQGVRPGRSVRKVAWEHDLGCNVTSALLATGDGVYAGCADRRLYRLAPATGAVTGQIELEAASYFALVAAGGSILALVGDSGLAAIDPELKGVRWKRTAPAGWTTPRPLVYGEMVLAGGPGELIALRVEDGAVVWTSKVEGTPRGLGLAGGVLYVGTLRGQLSAYELGAPGP